MVCILLLEPVEPNRRLNSTANFVWARQSSKNYCRLFEWNWNGWVSRDRVLAEETLRTMVAAVCEEFFQPEKNGLIPQSGW